MLVAAVAAILDRDLQALAREVAAYPDERALWQTPPGITNSGGTLAVHLAGNIRHYFGAKLGGTGYVRDRPAEFAARDLTRVTILAQIEEARAAVRAAAARTPDQRLEEDYPEVIAGVRVVVVWDTDYSEDVLEESELTFFAQDDDGNVWHLGQYRETYDEVEFVGGRIWIEGAPEGSKAGIMMHADPQLEMPSYSEGYAPPPFNWTDRARVYQMGEQVTGPTGSYDDVLVIEEYNQEEPGAFQHKYYARGVGIVYIGWRGDDQLQETMDLVEFVELDPEALGEARAEALALEARAYIYAGTMPAE
ncbi:MAG: hypothetical protein EHM35_03425 [Planctomycetaceae bacterium]|nr:MAG: hypothetical protein EHM35_03425 [Planctomycetaceae bacterium]